SLVGIEVALLVFLSAAAPTGIVAADLWSGAYDWFVFVERFKSGTAQVVNRDGVFGGHVGVFAGKVSPQFLQLAARLSGKGGAMLLLESRGHFAARPFYYLGADEHCKHDGGLLVTIETRQTVPYR